jgi:hypothetical protein
MFIRNVRLSELSGVTTQNTAVFITTAVKTLNPISEMDHETIRPVVHGEFQGKE